MQSISSVIYRSTNARSNSSNLASNPMTCHGVSRMLRESAQNSQFSSTDLMAHSNFSRSVLEKNFSMGTLNFLTKTTVSRGSM